MNRFVLMLVAVPFFSLLYGCGGGNDGQVTAQPVTEVPGSYVFPAGKAVIAFSAISTARLSVPVSAIDITLTLPQGMSVVTAGGLSGRVDDASITAGSALPGKDVYGSYSASTRKLHLSMITTNSSYRGGEFLRLTCNVAPAAVITLDNLRAINNPVSVVKAVGIEYDLLTLQPSTVPLTSSIKVTVGVSK